ncbi:hypothetical protein ACP70R_007867 [Stipagrostis hirtigluma subsp. patula]
MEFATGALSTLLPKLAKLLKDEYNLPKSVKKDIKFLLRELESSRVALHKVDKVPLERMDEQTKIWARDVRELSYDMEDIVDTFMVRVESPDAANTESIKGLIKMMVKVFKKGKTRHKIAKEIKEIRERVKDVAERRDRYKVDNINPAPALIDPRITALYTKTTNLVGMDKAIKEVITMLTEGDDMSMQQRIVSIVGFGGLGKTTLAKVVYDELKLQFECTIFISVSRNPDLKKFLKNMLYELDNEKYGNIHGTELHENQLINQIRKFLMDKRYFIVIDDIWEKSSWDIIRFTLHDNNLGSKTILTTRNSDVAIAEQVSCSYKMKPLHPESSKILFYGRIFGSEDKCPEHLFEVSEKVLKKCGGVPLAIITMSSLLANKREDKTQWNEVCKSIGSGLGSNYGMKNMRMILSLSYYDLPSHLKTCLLYLSVFPEDHLIESDWLIWKWIAEDFIQPWKKGDDLFELGQSYINELVNRSLVQAEMYSGGKIYGFRVHDMVLDFICSLSGDENCVAMSHDIQQNISSRSKTRRLSLKHTTWPTTSMSHVRALNIFSSDIVHSMPSLSSFGVLRILHIEECNLKDLKLSVGNLVHLRYLGLVNAYHNELPVGIEKLQFLQTLKLCLSCDLDILLPPTIFDLRELMCLDGIKCYPRQGHQLRNLASLRVLRELHLGKDSAGAVEELGHLTLLRELNIWIKEQMGQSLRDTLIKSLGYLQELQNLSIWQLKGNNLEWERWAPSPRLCSLRLQVNGPLPKWISSASLPHLSYLELCDVSNVGPENIQVLGTLPALCHLTLRAEIGNAKRRLMQRFMFSADVFPRVTECYFIRVVAVPSMLPRGAMPNVESIRLSLRSRDFFTDGGFHLDDLSIEHLPSLRWVVIDLYTRSSSEEEVTTVKEALNHAAAAHPNHLRIIINECK